MENNKNAFKRVKWEQQKANKMKKENQKKMMTKIKTLENIIKFKTKKKSKQVKLTPEPENKQKKLEFKGFLLVMVSDTFVKYHQHISNSSLLFPKSSSPVSLLFAPKKIRKSKKCCIISAKL